MRSTLGVLVVSAVVLVAPAAFAVSYASGVQQSGNVVLFTLNQPGNVTVQFDGGAGSLALGDLAAGGNVFQIPAGYTDYCIEVTSDTGTGWQWSQISTDDTSTSFYGPRGVSVDRNPDSPNFGSVYVSEGAPGLTAFGRTTEDGVYKLDAAMNDLGVYTGGVDWSGGSGPFKSTVGPDGHLYVANFNDDTLYEFSSDMSTATQIIGPDDKFEGQWISSAIVEGTQAGGDRVIYTVDSQYLGASRGLVKYDLGGMADADGPGQQYIGPDVFGFYPRDAVRDSDGNFYMNQFRYAPTEGAAIIKFQDGPDLPLDGDDILWETPPEFPYNGSNSLALFETFDYIAFGNYYDGQVLIFDKDTGDLLHSFDAGSRMYDIAFDAAGNVYTVDNLTEWLRVWSPGGTFVATTCSDGTFSVVPEPAALALLTLGLALVRRR